MSGEGKKIMSPFGRELADLDTLIDSRSNYRYGYPYPFFPVEPVVTQYEDVPKDYQLSDMNSYLIRSALQAEGVSVRRPIEVVYRFYEGSSPKIDDLTISVQSVKECIGTWKAGILTILEFIRTNNLHQYKIEIIDHLHLDSVGISPQPMPGMVRMGRPTDPVLALKALPWMDLILRGLSNIEIEDDRPDIIHCWRTCCDDPYDPDRQIAFAIKVKDPARRIWLEEVVPMILSIVGPKYEVDIWKSV